MTTSPGESAISEPRVLLSGLVFPESPRWHAGRLWLSDWGAQVILALDTAGHSQVMARVPSFPFCFDWLPDGRLLIVNARERRLQRQLADGSLALHVDLAPLSEQPWNEIVVDSRGNAYVNNIGFDFPQGQFAPGSIALVTPDGAARQVADGLAFPNGMVVTPDNGTLIVAESYASCLTAFEIGVDGSLSHRRQWAKVEGSAPDGICLDADHAIWYADVPNQQCVRVREGSAVLQTVRLDRGCFACELGGAGGRTLFIMANQWHGPESIDATGQGQVVAVQVATPVS